MDKFPFYSQLDMMDCGPACLRMIAKYYGNSYSLEMLRVFSRRTNTIVTPLSSGGQKYASVALCR